MIDEAVDVSKVPSVSTYELVSAAVYTQTCSGQKRFRFPRSANMQVHKVVLFDRLTGASPTL